MDGEGGEDKERKLNGVGKVTTETGGGEERWKGRRKEKGRKAGKGGERGIK